jgi:hypothetical protein
VLDAVGEPAGVRAIDFGRVAALRVRARQSLLARDPARLHRGHRLPRGRRKPGSRSHDDRRVPVPARAAVGRGVLRRPGVCARAGLASVGVVAIDGTKMAADASSDANRDSARSRARSSPRRPRSTVARTTSTAPSAATSCPSKLRTRAGRRRALREAKERLARERDAPQGFSDAGGGTRTPDTRIMIWRLGARFAYVEPS